MRLWSLGCLAVVCGLFLVTAPASAQWSDNFDSYVAGSGLHGQGGWMGWDDDPTWDAYVTDEYSHSAPNSVNITGSSDMTHSFSGYTSSRWLFKAWLYVPSSFAGQSYFIMLNTYNPGGPYNWSIQVSFNDTGIVQSDPELDTLPLVYDSWVEIVVEIDLDADLQTFYYDGQMLYQKSWAEGVSGGGSLNIGAVDLFANNASPIYYDDVSLTEDIPVAIQETTWGQVKSLFRGTR